ncbi:MAG: hypothetical protein LUO89_02035 [Methanothrix sp.]|nr:hypothetical protein [Methanothrix sp.]
MHFSALSTISPILMYVAIGVIVIAVTLLDAVIVIPAYALTFTSFYRFLEPGRVQAGATAPTDTQGSDEENAPTEKASLSDPTYDSSPEKAL